MHSTRGSHDRGTRAYPHGSAKLFTQAGYATDRKNVPHSRGKKKADLHIKDFRLEGIRNVIDVTLRGEFHGSCIDPARNGEASYADPNGAIDATVK